MQFNCIPEDILTSLNIYKKEKIKNNYFHANGIPNIYTCNLFAKISEKLPAFFHIFKNVFIEKTNFY